MGHYRSALYSWFESSHPDQYIPLLENVMLTSSQASLVESLPSVIGRGDDVLLPFPSGRHQQLVCMTAISLLLNQNAARRILYVIEEESSIQQLEPDVFVMESELNGMLDDSFRAEVFLDGFGDSDNADVVLCTEELLPTRYEDVFSEDEFDLVFDTSTQSVSVKIWRHRQL